MLIKPLEPCLEYTSGYKYQLNKESTYLIPDLEPYAGYNGKHSAILTDGILVLKDSYAWDGASGPTIDTPSSMRGSAVHDELFRLMRIGILPSTFLPLANKIMTEMYIIDGMWRWRANWWETGVKELGGVNSKPSRRKKLKYAP